MIWGLIYIQYYNGSEANDISSAEILRKLKIDLAKQLKFSEYFLKN